MANVKNVVTAEDDWGKFAGGCLIDEPYVDLYIPKDKLNKDNAKWIGLNGDSAYLAVGENLKVPQSIAKLWNDSYIGTQKAEEKMSEFVEIN